MFDLDCERGGRRNFSGRTTRVIEEFDLDEREIKASESSSLRFVWIKFTLRAIRNVPSQSFSKMCFKVNQWQAKSLTSAFILGVFLRRSIWVREVIAETTTTPCKFDRTSVPFFDGKWAVNRSQRRTARNTCDYCANANDKKEAQVDICWLWHERSIVFRLSLHLIIVGDVTHENVISRASRSCANVRSTRMIFKASPKVRRREERCRWWNKQQLS